ncbi:MAG: FAD-dependent oxidoreductase [Burkholderiaceae bacterium]
MSNVSSVSNESTFQRSLWSATATDAPICPTAVGATECDVAIVGAGYTGLSAALHLAQQGKVVTVLEAQEPGFGCSGRNGGQVNPGSSRMLPSDIVNTLGSYWGERFLEFGDRSSAIVFDLIQRYQIDCELVQPGYLQGGYGKRGRGINEAWAAQWRARGVEIRTLGHDEISSLTGTRVYDWGLLDPRGGSVQPLSYARGLARAAQSEGATVCANSPAQSIRRNGTAWQVVTPDAVVSCRHVILATNGYTDGLWPGLTKSVVPTASFLSATAPLEPSLLRTILPGRQAVSETARVIVYYRRDAAGRLIMGAHGNLFSTRELGDTQHVRREAVRLFPELADVGWEYDWAGWPAITKNHTPHLFRLDDGVYAGLGYNGRGVASATLMGAQLAAVILDSAEPLIEVRPLSTFKMHPFRQIGISFHLLSRKVLDRFDRR